MRCWRLASVALLAACADGPMPPESVGRGELAVINGTTDTTDDAVVSIVSTEDSSTPELCSGVLVAPRVVLTAGHCTLGQAPQDLLVGIGPDARSPTRAIAVARLVTYPQFTGAFDDLAAGLDLGAVVLAEDANVPSFALYVSGDEAALVSQEATVVGYGQSTGDVTTRGTRRSGATRIDAACSALLAFGDAASNACHGDSGGPLLVRDTGGSRVVAGVVSYGDEINCATASYAVRVDRYAAWIASIVSGENDGGDCSACPSRPVDCGIDAGVDAQAPPPPDAAVDAGALPAPVGSSGGGGCMVEPRAASGVAWLFAVTMLTMVLRRRSRARDTG